ncbi:DUF1489 family protein [Aquibaculum arenosum]|uniref:DUF1489 domain-containing protein n=1 Tax=Aquibaculum arenosum TaxID=3032591 RepID=A0ABT5YQK6_9PROT|nr:DUF1489 domain-containing protein [Fodinicurvata sp. CAU 1616]MDF2097137.1 DUF1489 domain-containing protein [Fodinicurvata sp. CAU 1616]
MASLHLIKLSVGSESIESLRQWQERRYARHGRLWHATRMMPRRKDELLDPEAPGSIYWVIRGVIQARQQLVGLESGAEEEGRSMTLLLLDPTLVSVVPTPKRPFQGWRYLLPEQAPQDLASGEGEEAGPPPAFLAELRALGIL